MAPVSKSKRVGLSKNRKKYWKKFANVEDVKSYLEQEIKDEILGKASKKKNEELFVVETKEKITPKRRSRSEWQNKQLKCYSILESSSQVAPPIKPNRQVQSKRQKNKTEEQDSVVTKSEEKSEKQPTEVYDVWDQPDISITNGLMDKDLEDYYKTQTKRKGRKVPNTYYLRPSALPAVEVVKAGASYNPSYVDHQALLGAALNVEINKQKEEKKLIRALDEKFPTACEAPNQESWLTEMSQGIMVGGEAEESDGEEIDGTAPLTLNPPVRADKRKSENRRRKERRLKLEALAAEKERRDEIKSNEVFRIKSIAAEIMNEKYESQAKQLKKKIEKLGDALKPAKLSKYKYEEPEMELLLSNELSGNLRGMKTDGNVLHDRFKSFQRRNIIESRIKQKKTKRKFRLKTFPRKGCADVTN
ncbi:hypothetical protein CHUAL_006177 [Chamberlinius hualienensis]